VFTEQAAERDSLRGRVAREVEFPDASSRPGSTHPSGHKPPVEPCRAACPLGQDIPGYIEAIARGKPQEASEIIRRTNPFPSICGRLCPASCIRACVRDSLDQGVHIRALKRFAAEAASGSNDTNRAAAERKPRGKVAIVGSGPAGLSAGWHLARQGWEVVVHEAESHPGGLLAKAVGGFDLDPEVLRREIESIEAAGVEIKLQNAIHGRRPLTRLREEGYDAVVVATGASRALGLDLDGWGRIKGTWDIVSFAEQVNRAGSPELVGPVVVSGGGAAAVSGARAARRACKQPVYLVLPRSRRETPAPADALARAEQEGVEIIEESAVIKLEGKKDLDAVQIAPLRFYGPDRTDKRRMRGPKESEARRVEARHVVGGSLRLGDTEWLNGERVLLGPLGNIISPNDTFNLGPPWLFGAGEAITGAKTVVEAIATGIRAARQVDGYLESSLESTGAGESAR
jgi:NADH-quinone oxidoreductase subunit F